MNTDHELGFFISRQQRRQWALSRRLSTWFMADIAITGQLDSEVLHQALLQAQQRHEIFHTRFIQEAEMVEPVQQLTPDNPAFEWLMVQGGPTQGVSDQPEKEVLFKAILYVGDQNTTLRIFLSSLIGDYRSIGLLLNELAGIINGDAIDDEEIVQYVDFSQWQDEVVEEDVAAREFWQHQGLDHLAYPRLLRAANGNHQGREQVTVPLLGNDDIGSAQPHFLTLWLTLLQRFSGASELACQVLFDGRLSEAFSDGIGPYERMIPLQVKFDGDMSGDTLSASVNRQIAALDTNQMSLPVLPDEALGNDSMVGFECAELPQGVSAGGMTLTLTSRRLFNDDCSLKLSCFKKNGVWSATLDFDCAQHGIAFITVLGEAYQALVLHWQAQKPLAHQRLVSEQQQMASLVQAPLYDQSAMLPALFEQAVASHGNQTAIVWQTANQQQSEHQQIDYQQFNARVNRLSNALIEQGIGRTKIVAVCFERGLTLAIALMAVLKSGAAYSAIDPQTPTQRFLTVLADADLLLMDEHSAQLSALTQWDGQTLRVNAQLSDFEHYSQSNPQVAIASEDIAYILYTSGSTGKPKGVEVTHGGLTNYLQHCGAAYLSEAEGSVVHTSVGFDLSVTSLLAPLTVGKKVVMVPDDIGVEALKDTLLAQTGKVMLKLTPAHLKALNPWLQTLSVEQFMVDTLIVGGEALYPGDIAVCHSRFAGLKIYNEYGPTEATVGCSIYLCKGDEKQENVISIGRPLSGFELVILDDAKQPLPGFIAGELYIGGVGLAAGYLNMAQMTDERFVNVAGPDGVPRRLYKTGDIARFNGINTQNDSDGFEYLGRNDSQVKIRGYRIEIGEVEAVLKSTLDVEDVALKTRKNQFNELELVAYLQTGSAQTLSDVNAAVSDILPNFMLPSHVICLAQFALTTNGKVDLDALPDVSQQSKAAEQPYIAPRNETETHLVEAFTSALALDKVGIKDNFFALGGDSIRAVHVVSQVNEYGYDLKVMDLFGYPTIEQLSTVVTEKQADQMVQHSSMLDALLDEIEGMSEKDATLRLVELEGKV